MAAQLHRQELESIELRSQLSGAQLDAKAMGDKLASARALLRNATVAMAAAGLPPLEGRGSCGGVSAGGVLKVCCTFLGFVRTACRGSYPKTLKLLPKHGRPCCRCASATHAFLCSYIDHPLHSCPVHMCPRAASIYKPCCRCARWSAT
jgi:hypothetical protein